MGKWIRTLASSKRCLWATNETAKLTLRGKEPFLPSLLGLETYSFPVTRLWAESCVPFWLNHVLWLKKFHIICCNPGPSPITNGEFVAMSPSSAWYDSSCLYEFGLSTNEEVCQTLVCGSDQMSYFCNSELLGRHMLSWVCKSLNHRLVKMLFVPQPFCLPCLLFPTKPSSLLRNDFIFFFLVHCVILG